MPLIDDRMNHWLFESDNLDTIYVDLWWLEGGKWPGLRRLLKPGTISEWVEVF